MSSTALFQNPVAINKLIHKNTHIKTFDGDFSFCKNFNTVGITGAEFANGYREYPILFTRQKNKYEAITVLGLKNKENWFVDGNGKWDADYIPAFVRRFPFVLAKGDDEQLVVCIDESFKELSEEPGPNTQPLYENGKESAMLQHSVKFLTEYHQQYLRTGEFIARLDKFDLFKSVDAKVNIHDDQRYMLRYCYVIDEEKLAKLSAEKLMEFYRAGEMMWIYAHINSIQNLRPLAARHGNRIIDEPVAEEA